VEPEVAWLRRPAAAPGEPASHTRAATAPPRPALRAQLKASMVVMGLANSGKSSIVRRLHPHGEQLQDELVPTVGFAVEHVDCQRSRLTVIDMSGQEKYLQLWEHFFTDVQVGRWRWRWRWR
jgi:GTPase SAR1 family protein